MKLLTGSTKFLVDAMNKGHLTNPEETINQATIWSPCLYNLGAHVSTYKDRAGKAGHLSS